MNRFKFGDTAINYLKNCCPKPTYEWRQKYGAYRRKAIDKIKKYPKNAYEFLEKKLYCSNDEYFEIAFCLDADYGTRFLKAIPPSREVFNDERYEMLRNHLIDKILDSRNNVSRLLDFERLTTEQQNKLYSNIFSRQWNGNIIPLYLIRCQYDEIQYERLMSIVLSDPWTALYYMKIIGGIHPKIQDNLMSLILREPNVSQHALNYNLYRNDEEMLEMLNKASSNQFYVGKFLKNNRIKIDEIIEKANNTYLLETIKRDCILTIDQIDKIDQKIVMQKLIS